MTVPRVTEAKWTPQCMTPAELAAWMDMARRVRKGARRPCVDCPAAHARAMREAGCCNGLRATGGRPRLSGPVKPRGRGNPYATEEERIAARRQSWRESSRRRKAAHV